MFELSMTNQHKIAYEKLEKNLMLKVFMGTITNTEAAKILDNWLQEHGY